MKKIISLFLVIILSFTLCACKNAGKGSVEVNSAAAQSATELGEGEASFVFVVADADGNQKVFNISTNKTIVGDALKEHNLISGDEGDFGLYVKTVNGKTYDYDKDGKYWAFYIDGEYASSGVDKTTINPQSTYMFKVE